MKNIIDFTKPIHALIAIGLITIFALLLSNKVIANNLAEFVGQVQDEYIEVKTISITDKVVSARIDKVIDGDTAVTDDGIRLRYLNIDTPESVKPETKVQCYSKEAYEFNKSLVENKRVYLMYDKGKQDRYGRDLVFIFLNKADIGNISKSVNAELVKEGYARTVVYAPNKTYADEFFAYQSKAEKQNKGLWKACDNPFSE